MSVSPAVEASGKPSVAYTDPVVQSFYVNVLSAMEDAPDGASAASVITGDFQRHHHTFSVSNNALQTDVRRLSAEDSRKAAMLSHAGTFAGRMVADHMRLVGQLHGHQGVESQLHELALQLDETAAGIADQIRGILESIRPVDVAVGAPVVVAYAPDQRWSTGWFRNTTKLQEGPKQPLPFCGWALVAHDPESPAQGVVACFLHDGTWYTKHELAARGLLLDRID